MKKMIRVFVLLGLMVSTFVGICGCGSSTPQVYGEQKDPVALPAYATAWLAKVTDGDNTTDTALYYFDANNQLVGLTMKQITPGTTTTTNGFTMEIKANTFVRDQEVTMSKLSGTAAGVSMIFYMNYKIVDGNLAINGTQVTATSSLYTSIDLTTGEAITVTTTMTGTLQDENTIKFTSANIQTVPANANDGQKTVNVTWIKQ